jgi:hypothetical protein
MYNQTTARYAEANLSVAKLNEVIQSKKITLSARALTIPLYRQVLSIAKLVASMGQVVNPNDFITAMTLIPCHVFIKLQLTPEYVDWPRFSHLKACCRFILEGHPEYGTVVDWEDVVFKTGMKKCDLVFSDKHHKLWFCDVTTDPKLLRQKSKSIQEELANFGLPASQGVSLFMDVGRHKMGESKARREISEFTIPSKQMSELLCGMSRSQKEELSALLHQQLDPIIHDEIARKEPAQSLLYQDLGISDAQILQFAKGNSLPTMRDFFSTHSLPGEVLKLLEGVTLQPKYHQILDMGVCTMDKNNKNALTDTIKTSMGSGDVIICPYTWVAVRLLTSDHNWETGKVYLYQDEIVSVLDDWKPKDLMSKGKWKRGGTNRNYRIATFMEDKEGAWAFSVDIESKRFLCVPGKGRSMDFVTKAYYPTEKVASRGLKTIPVSLQNMEESVEGHHSQVNYLSSSIIDDIDVNRHMNRFEGVNFMNSSQITTAAISYGGLQTAFLRTRFFASVSHQASCAVTITKRSTISRGWFTIGYNDSLSSLTIMRSSKGINMDNCPYIIWYLTSDKPMQNRSMVFDQGTDNVSLATTGWQSITSNQLEWNIKLPSVVMLMSQYYDDFNKISDDQHKKDVREVVFCCSFATINRQSFSIISECSRYSLGSIESYAGDAMGCLKKLKNMGIKTMAELCYMVNLCKTHICCISLKHSGQISALYHEGKSNKLDIPLPSWTTSHYNLELQTAAKFDKNIFNKAKTFKETSEAHCMYDLLEEWEIYKKMSRDHPTFVKGVNKEQESVIHQAHSLSDPQPLFDYLSSVDFQISQREKYDIFFKQRFDKIRFSWDLWITMMALIDANSITDFDTIYVKEESTVYESFFGMSVSPLFAAKGSMDLNKILIVNQGQRKTSSILHVIACMIKGSFVNINDSYRVIKDHCDSVYNPYMSIGLLKLWMENQDYGIIIRLFDKDQSGGSREISALNAVGIVSAYYSEKSYSYISKVKSNDAINEPNKEKIIYKLVQGFDESPGNDVLYLSADMSRFGPNTNQCKLILANGTLTTDRRLLNSLNDTCVLMAQKRFKMPQGIMDVFTSTSDLDLNEYAVERPKNIMSQLWEILSLCSPGWKNDIQSGFKMEFGMTQGIMGTQSSVVVSSYYDLIMKYLINSGEIIKGSSLSTSDDSLGVFEVPQGDLKQQAINLFSKITFLFSLSGHIVNPSKSYMSQNIAELNSQWLLNKIPIVTPLKHAIASLNPGGGLNPIEDCLKVNYAGVDLLRKGSSVRLACLLSSILAVMHLEQYNLLSINNTLYGIAPIDVLPLPFVCPLESLVHPMAAVYGQYIRMFPSKDKEVLLSNITAHSVLLYSGKPIKIESSTNPILGFEGIPLRAEDQVFRAKFKAHYSIARIAREVGVKGGLFPDLGQFKRESLSLSDVIIGSWYDLTHEAKMTSNDHFLSRYIDPMRSDGSIHYTLGAGTFAKHLMGRVDISYSMVAEHIMSTSNQSLFESWEDWLADRGDINPIFKDDVSYTEAALRQVQTFFSIKEIFVIPDPDFTTKDHKQTYVLDKDHMRREDVERVKKGVEGSIFTPSTSELNGFFEGTSQVSTFDGNRLLVSHQQQIESLSHLILKFSKEVGGKFTNRFSAYHISSYSAAIDLLTNNFMTGMRTTINKPGVIMENKRAARRTTYHAELELDPPVPMAIAQYNDAMCLPTTRSCPVLNKRGSPYTVTSANLIEDKKWRDRIWHLYRIPITVKAHEVLSLMRNVKNMVWHGSSSLRIRKSPISMQQINDVFFEGSLVTMNWNNSNGTIYKHVIIVKKLDIKTVTKITDYTGILITSPCYFTKRLLSRHVVDFIAGFVVAFRTNAVQRPLEWPDEFHILGPDSIVRGLTIQLGNSTLCSILKPLQWYFPMARTDHETFRQHYSLPESVVVKVIAIKTFFEKNEWDFDQAISFKIEASSNLIKFREDKTMLSYMLTYAASFGTDTNRHRSILPVSLMQNLIERSSIYSTKLMCLESIRFKGVVIYPDAKSLKLAAIWDVLLSLFSLELEMSYNQPETFIEDGPLKFWKFSFGPQGISEINTETSVLYRRPITAAHNLEFATTSFGPDPTRLANWASLAASIPPLSAFEEMSSDDSGDEDRLDLFSFDN